MTDKRNKILVALDGSKKAEKTVGYLCAFQPFRRNKLVLCNIITKVPEYYYDLKKEPFSGAATSRVHSWEHGYKAQIQSFMEASKMKLIAAGFRPEDIQIMISERKKGIARDILDEAGSGDYDMLLCRRRGGAKLMMPITLGSVSTKLIEKASGIPLILAGTHEVTHRICVAIDGSKGAKRAVEFTARTVENSDCRIVLCSVLRQFDVMGQQANTHKIPGILKKAFISIEAEMDEAKAIFENAGIKKSRITTRIVQGVKSRAEAIAGAAREEHCDTVVFGRKGRSEVSEFDIGRIPLKVIHGAKKMTVWIVP